MLSTINTVDAVFHNVKQFSIFGTLANINNLTYWTVDSDASTHKINTSKYALLNGIDILNWPPHGCTKKGSLNTNLYLRKTNLEIVGEKT